MHRIRSKLTVLALTLCILAAAAIVPRAFAAGNSQTHVDSFAQQGWLDGVAVDGLQADTPINRAQFTSIVNRLAGLIEESGNITAYTDVPADSPYRADLSKALTAGYMSGTSRTTLYPAGPLTRQDAAVMLARLMGLTASQEDARAMERLSDSAAVSGYARDGVAAMYAKGYLSVSGGKLEPGRQMTLADAVTLLHSVQSVLAGSTGLEGYHFVLMNIPYADFYAADVENDEPVDGVTSATLNKTRTGTLVSGSYHVDSEGTDITGITFPVAVPDGTDLSAYPQIKDSDSIDITVTNRDNTSTATYAGKDALFQNVSYAYYPLTSAPSYYKTLSVGAGGGFTFGETVGEAKALTGVTAKLTTETSYGDYQVSVTGLPEIETVYAVVLETKEGDSYGLRHMENVWRVSELAWCTGFTEAVHNCPTSSDHYKAMMGQTIKRITYYTENGILTFPVELYVPVKFNHTLETAEVAVSDKAAALTMTDFPKDYKPVYTVTDAAGTLRDTFSCDGKTLSWTDASAGTHTLAVSDEGGKYASYKVSFTLTTENVPATAAETGLVKAKGASDADFACYLASITSVKVNDTEYAASGRGAVTVIGKDGKVDFSSAAFAELAGQTVTITITAQGCQKDLTMSVTVPETLPAANSGGGGQVH